MAEPIAADDLEARLSRLSGANVDANALESRLRGLRAPGGSQPSQPPQQGWGPYINNLGRMAAQGVTFGFADELAAGADAALGTAGDVLRGQPTDFSGRYARNLDAERAQTREFRDQYPVAATASELGGAVTGGLGAARVLPRVFGVAGPSATGVRGAVQLAGQGARAGAAGGALSGFGDSEGGLENRLSGAAQGGTLGAVAGGILPPIAAGVARGAGMVAGPIANVMGLRNAERAGMGQLLRAFERDGISLEDAGRRYQQWVNDGARPETLVDLGGENVRAFAQRLVNVPGASRQAGRAAVEERTMGQADRVGGDVARNFGASGRDFYPTLDALDTARRTAAQPAYERAYARDFVPNERIMGWLERPAMRDAARRAYAIAANEGRDPMALGLQINAAGDVTYTRAPSMQTLDYIKRGLDDVVEQFRDRVTGRLHLDESGRAINNLRAEYVRELCTLNPDYAEALDAWAGPTQLRDAMARGRNIFSPDAEVTAATVRRMSGGERDAFRIGLVRAIEDRIGSTTDGRNVVASFFRNPAMREKIAAAFDNPAAFARFEAAMQREMDMAQVNPFMNPRANSMTSRMLAEGADQSIDVPGSALMSFMTGHPIQALRQVGGSALNGLQGMNSATSDALAPILFQTTPAGNAQALGLLNAEANRRAFALRQRRGAGIGLIGGAASGAALQNQ